MNNARESYCLLIETNPRVLSHPHRRVSSFLFPPVFPRLLSVLFTCHPSPPHLVRSLSLSLFLSLVLALSVSFSFPNPSSLFIPAPPNRPAQMRAPRFLSLYSRIKRIVYDKSSVSSLTKRPSAHCSTVHEPMRLHDTLNERTNERTNKRTNERTNERASGYRSRRSRSDVHIYLRRCLAKERRRSYIVLMGILIARWGKLRG